MPHVTEYCEIRRQQQRDKEDPVGIYLSIAKNAKSKNTTTLDSQKSPWLDKHGVSLARAEGHGSFPGNEPVANPFECIGPPW
jgi:hypothetical protein